MIDNMETLFCKIYNYIQNSKLEDVIQLRKSIRKDYCDISQIFMNDYLLKILIQIEKDFHEYYDLLFKYSFLFPYRLNALTSKQIEIFKLKEKQLIEEDEFLKICPVIAKIRAIDYARRVEKS